MENILSKPLIRPTRPGDARAIADRLCVADSKEIKLLTDVSPEQVLLDSVASSPHAFTIELNGMPIAMFGCTGDQNEAGAPWMLSTPETAKATSLMREARQIVRDLLIFHGYLANFVWVKNQAHIDFINWLGFAFTDTVFERGGEKFVWFEMLEVPQ